jgi:uncharacterized protein (TIGR03083 family)
MHDVDLGDQYALARGRVSDLVLGLTLDQLATPTRACPGWTVHDVVGHLVGIVDDAANGRLKGIPTEDQTHEQVMRNRTVPMATMIATWSAMAPGFEAAVRANSIWPAVMDCLSHEHDIRAAVAKPGNRDVDMVRIGARRLTESIDVGARVSVTLDGSEAIVVGAGDNVYELQTTSFDMLRLRLGRRTRSEVLALDWSTSAEPIVDKLFVFGPAEHSINE